jgi:hypothetical protein
MQTMKHNKKKKKKKKEKARTYLHPRRVRHTAARKRNQKDTAIQQQVAILT